MKTVNCTASLMFRSRVTKLSRRTDVQLLSGLIVLVEKGSEIFLG